MSDPAKDGYRCCDSLMDPITLPNIRIYPESAFACFTCSKWRHALPPGDARRPQVVKAMNDWADDNYRRTQANGNR